MPAQGLPPPTPSPSANGSGARAGVHSVPKKHLPAHLRGLLARSDSEVSAASTAANTPNPRPVHEPHKHRGSPPLPSWQQQQEHRNELTKGVAGAFESFSEESLRSFGTPLAAGGEYAPVEVSWKEAVSSGSGTVGEAEGEPLPPFHFEVLWGGEADSPPRQKVVLLHGWHQESSSWGETARGLQAGGKHDVLLIDFFAHGKSQAVYPYHKTTVETLVNQVRSAVDRLGWGGEKLVMGGLSLGGAVSLRFADAHPERVGAIVLVSSPGLGEPWWSLVWLLVLLRWTLTLLSITVAWLTYPFASHLTHLDASDPGCARSRSRHHNAGLEYRRGHGGFRLWLNRLAGHCRLVWDTPRYGVPADMPERLKEKGIKLNMVWGKADVLHTAQTQAWGAGRRTEAIVVPHWDHTLCCLQFDKVLRLWEKAHWWSLEQH